MIIVKVELHSARTGQITELGRAHISNTGDNPSHPTRGDYLIELFRKGSTTKVQRKGLLRDYPRNSYTVWELVRRCLETALGKWPVHPGHPIEFDENRNPLDWYGDSSSCEEIIYDHVGRSKMTIPELVRTIKDYGFDEQAIRAYVQNMLDKKQLKINKEMQLELEDLFDFTIVRNE